MDTKNIQNKTVVTVRRKWHLPEIHAFISNEEVGAKMDVYDFIKAVIIEMYGEKNRMLMLSKDAAIGLAVTSADSVITEMKQSTSMVV